MHCTRPHAPCMQPNPPIMTQPALPALRYAWGYVETKQGVRRGDRVWQLAFGSGFKCNSAVWVALRDCNDQHDAWTDTPSC